MFYIPGYRDNITFLKNLNSVIEVSGLKPESSKYETAGIGALKDLN